MEPSVESQAAAADAHYKSAPDGRWDFNYVDDPLVRYLRDRRLELALDLIGSRVSTDGSALVVCGGTGGEGAYLLRRGFADVTVTDISPHAVEICASREPRLKTAVMDAEAIDSENDSYDLVVVQDGLHHLPRPTLGLTEMLRVARRAVVVIEPHDGIVGRWIGTTWERQGDAVNYVFRWTEDLLKTVSYSYLGPSAEITARRLWDHSGVISKVTSRQSPRVGLAAARAIYGFLRPASRLGNMMVGVVIKP